MGIKEAILTYTEEKGIKKGIEQGIERGIELGIYTAIQNMYERNVSNRYGLFPGCFRR